MENIRDTEYQDQVDDSILYEPELGDFESLEQLIEYSYQEVKGHCLSLMKSASDLQGMGLPEEICQVGRILSRELEKMVDDSMKGDASALFAYYKGLDPALYGYTHFYVGQFLYSLGRVAQMPLVPVFELEEGN